MWKKDRLCVMIRNGYMAPSSWGIFFFVFFSYLFGLRDVKQLLSYDEFHTGYTKMHIQILVSITYMLIYPSCTDTNYEIVSTHTSFDKFIYAWIGLHLNSISTASSYIYGCNIPNNQKKSIMIPKCNYIHFLKKICEYKRKFFIMLSELL